MKKKDDTFKVENANVGLQYTDTAFLNGCVSADIKQRSVMNAVGHTNPTTYARWIGGADIYLRSLLDICNATGLELLSMFQYYGHGFKSRIEDLYRLELTGHTVADILEQRGIDRSEGSAPISQERRDAINRTIIEQANAYESQTADDLTQPQSLNAFIDRIIDLQNKSHEREMSAIERQRTESRDIIERQRSEFIAQLDTQRKEMQAEMERQVNDRQQHINRLLTQVATLQARLSAYEQTPESLHPRMVSDTARPASK